MDTADKNLIALLNTGDKRELKAFLKLYSKPVYDRALALTGTPESAYEVTRRVIVEVVHLARRGELREDIDAQLMAITDSICEEERFFASMVDNTVDALIPNKTLSNDYLHYTAPAKESWVQTGVQDTRNVYHPPAPPIARQSEPPAPYRGEFAPTANMHQPPVYGPPQSQMNPVYVPQPQSNQDYPPQQQMNQAYAPPVYENTANANESTQHADIGTDIKDILEDEDMPRRKASPFLVILIFFLAAVVVALVWMLIVKLMLTFEWFPKFDFGYTFSKWFNVNFFDFF